MRRWARRRRPLLPSIVRPAAGNLTEVHSLRGPSCWLAIAYGQVSEVVR